MSNETDWRIEGTAANRRVERLTKKSAIWGRITEVMIAITWVALITTVFLEVIKKHDWMLWVSIGQWVLTIACYVRFEVLRVKLKGLTGDE